MGKPTDELTTLHQGPGYTIARDPVARTVVPYGGLHRPDGSRSEGFVDLRDRPELVDRLPEARRCPGLADLLRAANDPARGVMTLGCDCGVLRTDPSSASPPSSPFTAGAYVDVAFRDPARNADSRAVEDLAHRILAGVPAPPDEHQVSFAILVRPLLGFFGAEGTHHVAMLKPAGYGATDRAALEAMSWAASALASSIRALTASPATAPPGRPTPTR